MINAQPDPECNRIKENNFEIKLEDSNEINLKACFHCAIEQNELQKYFSLTPFNIFLVVLMC